MTYIKLFISLLLLLVVQDCFSQELNSADSASLNILPAAGKLHVSALNISGNRRTKAYIILREIQFKAGDSLSTVDLANTLEQARRQVYNLNLFSEVTLVPVMLSANDVNVAITVREKWYIYPTPQFQLADRNFNEWWQRYNADFNRVIYGLKFSHYNFSGRGDQLRIFLLNGYARNISFSYNTPASKKSFIKGFRITAGYTQNREISFKTSDSNSLVQFKKPGFVRTSLYGSLSYQARQGFFKRHFYTISYNYININDSIIDPKYNSNYFGTNKTSIGVLDLVYSFSYSNTDNNNYPLDGTVYGFSIQKRGLGFKGGVNMLSLWGVYSKYLPHKKTFYSSIQLYSKIILPFTQAYINQRSIGYADFYLRGLEKYVVDGVAAAVAKYTLKKKLFAFDIKVPFHIRFVPKVPFAFFAKTYGDAGYSYIKKQFDTKLNNRFLYTYGFGLDILSLYDSNVSFEYSFNQLGENGLFLHARIGL
ncbi:MAG: POTRA domain-containing protein [Ferruginibacter sp.]